MSFILRKLSINDVFRALKQRKLGVAVGISKNLVGNAVNSVRFRLQLRPQRVIRRRVREGIMIPRELWIIRVITGLAGLGLQLVGLYGAYVVLGAWITVALYALGALVLIVQQIIVRRLLSCSLGE